MGEVRKNIAWFTLSNVFSALSSVLTSILVARYMGRADYSVYSLTFSLFSAEMILVFAGIQNFNVEEISKHPERIRDVVLTTIKLRTIIFILASLLFSTGSLFIYGNVDVVKLLIIANVFILGYYIEDAMTSALIPHAKPEYLAVSEVSYDIALLVGVVILGHYNRVTAFSVMTLRSVLQIPCLLYVALMYRRYILSIREKLANYKYRLLDIVRDAKEYMLIAVIEAVSSNFGVLFLPLVLGITYVGLYSVVALSYTLTSFFSWIMANSVFSPLVKLKTRGFVEDHRRLVTLSILTVFSFSLALSTVLNYYGVEIYDLLFNGKYDVSQYLKYATMTIPLYVPAPVLIYVAYSINRKKDVIFTKVTSFLIYAFLVYLLTKSFGLKGLFTATVLINAYYTALLLRPIIGEGVIRVEPEETALFSIVLFVMFASFLPISFDLLKPLLIAVPFVATVKFLKNLIELDGEVSQKIANLFTGDDVS